MIAFDNVSKIYCNSIDRSRSYAIRDMLRRKKRDPGTLRKNEFLALKDVSFHLNTGESLLILGTPLSGKSTIARLICGLTSPTAGSVRGKGKTRIVYARTVCGTPFMRVREYLRLLSTLLGADTSKLNRICGEILERCGLQSWANTRLHNVPGHCLAKLTFFTCLFIPSDIYIFDEIMSVGNGVFKEICQERIEEIFSKHTAVVLTRKFDHLPHKIDKAFFLHKGEILHSGSLQSMCTFFQRFKDSAHTDSVEYHTAEMIDVIGDEF
jgi:lipopolysaccharide transport system ATP-binding protein